MVSIRSAPLLGLIFLAVGAFLPLRSSAAETPEVSTFLQSLARESARGFCADFREERTLPLFAEPIRESGTLEFRPPAFFRKETRSPRPSLTLSDGKTLWLLFPEENEGEAYPLRRSSRLREVLTTLIACLDPAQIPKTFLVEASFTPSGTRLSLTPKTSALRSVFQKATLFFDSQPVLKSLTLHSADGGVAVMEFSAHRQPVSPPEAFSAPQNYQISYPLGQ